MSHKKFGPDRFSRFDVYWIQTDKQTNRQTDKQTDKPNLYIDKDNKTENRKSKFKIINNLKCIGLVKKVVSLRRNSFKAGNFKLTKLILISIS